MYKYILIFLIILINNICLARDGQIGTTSTATCHITVIIPEKVEITQDSDNPEKIDVKTNNPDQTYQTQEIILENGTRIIIIEPQ